MGVAPIRVGDIPEREFVQLLIVHAPKSMERNKNGPYEQQSGTTYCSEHF